MAETVDEQYVRWLISQVEGGRDLTGVLGLMFVTEFVWLVPWDDNRLNDGLDLRAEFGKGDISWPGSVLEVMIGLSRRMAFQVGGTPAGWARQFLQNLDLERFKDPLGPRRSREATEILESLVYRNYAPDGTVSFFPLQQPDEDMSKVEIWYQMAAYIDEILPD